MATHRPRDRFLPVGTQSFVLIFQISRWMSGRWVDCVCVCVCVCLCVCVFKINTQSHVFATTTVATTTAATMNTTSQTQLQMLSLAAVHLAEYGQKRKPTANENQDDCLTRSQAQQHSILVGPSLPPPPSMLPPPSASSYRALYIQ